MKIYMVSLLHRVTINYTRQPMPRFSQRYKYHSHRSQCTGQLESPHSRSHRLHFSTILTNVNVVRYMLSPVRLSSVCLSVTLVHTTQAVQIFRNISTALGTLAIIWHSLKISWRSCQGNLSVGGVKNTRGVAKYSDFGPIDGYISETVQDSR